jgi:preprotein translocase subunit SecE
MFKALKEYIKGAYKELRKVQWPTIKETWRYSLIIIGLSAVVAVFVAAVDFVFGSLIDLIP